MKFAKVTCDGCGADISSTGNSIDYRLLLTAEELPPAGMSVTDMMIYPPIKQDAHFCGLGCLAVWLTKFNKQMAKDTPE